jgi:hypothetical protein
MIVDLENLFMMGKKKITQGDNNLKIEWYLYEIGIIIKTIIYILITEKWAERSPTESCIEKNEKLWQLVLIKIFLLLKSYLCRLNYWLIHHK